MPTKERGKRLGTTVRELRDLAHAACRACGARVDLAEALVEASLDADWAGRPELGLAHLPDYLDGLTQGRIDGQALPLIARPAAAAIRIDLAGSVPQYGFDLAFADLVAAARQAGIAILAAHGGFTCGELGYYVRRLAGRGLVAIATANAHAMLSTGGPAPVYSTNPMAFAAPLPAPHPPLVIDQASSAAAYVNIRRAALEGRAIPDGWALDALGQPTTDPVRALSGMLLPFGGAKGANIALMVEVMAAGLAGAEWSMDAGEFHQGGRRPDCGLTVIALDPRIAGADFAARLMAQLDRLQELGVHIPGQRHPGRAMAADDVLQVPEALLARLLEWAGAAN